MRIYQSRYEMYLHLEVRFFCEFNLPGGSRTVQSEQDMSIYKMD